MLTSSIRWAALWLALTGGCSGRAETQPPVAPPPLDRALFNVTEFTIDGREAQSNETHLPPGATCQIAGRFRLLDPKGGFPFIVMIYVLEEKPGGGERILGSAQVYPKTQGDIAEFKAPLELPEDPGRFEIRVLGGRRRPADVNKAKAPKYHICRSIVRVTATAP